MQKYGLENDRTLLTKDARGSYMKIIIAFLPVPISKSFDFQTFCLGCMISIHYPGNTRQDNEMSANEQRFLAKSASWKLTIMTPKIHNVSYRSNVFCNHLEKAKR